MIINDEKKEKRIKNLMKLDLKKQFKELIYDRNDTIEPNNIFTKSNKNLANNMNEKLKYMSPLQNSVKKQKRRIIGIKQCKSRIKKCADNWCSPWFF